MEIEPVGSLRLDFVLSAYTGSFLGIQPLPCRWHLCRRQAAFPAIPVCEPVPGFDT